jgi:hypothetical protein
VWGREEPLFTQVPREVNSRKFTPRIAPVLVEEDVRGMSAVSLGSQGR